MANDLATITVSDIRSMAVSIANSKLFGVKTPDEAMALMLIAHAEGRHPALAARDYDIIQGKPAKKSEAMLRDFLQAGGKVEWHELTDTKSDATFSHPEGGTIRISWDMERAKAAGLGGKEMWKKYPRQMLRARLVSEGIKTVCPMATSGMYVPEEIQDLDAPKVAAPIIDVKHTVVEPPVKSEKDELTEFSKTYASDIDLVEDLVALENIVRGNAAQFGKLHDKYPLWHEKLVTLLDKRREALSSIKSDEVAL